MKRVLLAAIFIAASFHSAASSKYGFIDNMQNTSNLSDSEIEWYLQNRTITELTEALDRNGDGFADGTNKKVGEFIARMQVILICRRERLEELKRRQQEKRMYRSFSDQIKLIDT